MEQAFGAMKRVSKGKAVESTDEDERPRLRQRTGPKPSLEETADDVTESASRYIIDDRFLFMRDFDIFWVFGNF